MRILLVFLLLLWALFQYAHPDPSYDKNCSPFVCGKYWQIGYPFTNTVQTEQCGPFVVKGCSEDLQEIQLERGSGKWYQLEGISQADAISITDREFQTQLNANSCKSFNNFSFPKLNFSSPFQIISKNLTLLKCQRNFKAASNFTKFCLKHRDCPDFIIYYPPPNKTLPSPPPGCTIIVLPANTSNSHDDIFRLLTATFSLSALVSPPCYQCYLQGNCKGEFSRCNKVNRTPLGRKNEALGLGIGLGAGGPVAIAILVLIWCLYKRKHAPSDFTTTNNSFDNSSNTTLLNAGNAYFTVPIFSYDELEEATNNFDPQGELGDGGFGTVYYGRLRDGREVAVKHLYERNYKKFVQFMNEIEILTRLRHPNLISLYGCTSRHSRELLLVYEYISNGTVADHLHGDRAMRGQPCWPIRMRIAIETASALSYLHASGIIHRDVKTNNILLDMNFCVKVADFGISRLFPIDATHVSTAPQGTPGYVDPEYYQCYQLTDKSDVYSFGVVLIELISSLPAVDITRERHEINLATLAINKIQKCKFEELIDPNLGYNTDEEIERMITSVTELAFRCLQQDKEMRPSMDEVLEELITIEGKENELENSDEKQNDNTRKESIEPLHTGQYRNEISLLKNMHPPPNSPNSTVEKWLNSYTTRST